MREDLENEKEALNSIYGEDTLRHGDSHSIFILKLPNQDTTLRLEIPEDYPSVPPTLLGVESSGESSRKGDATRLLEVFRDALGRLFQPGEVCLFDVIEDVTALLHESAPDEVQPNGGGIQDQQALEESHQSTELDNAPLEEPPWFISDVVVELKSVFVARCASVSSPSIAKRYLQYLLDNDKRVRNATHNITAWRIRGEHGVTFQDCDDDGESMAGGRVLHLMQLMDLWNVMVIVTRWYGGQKLGPARFGIINTVAKDAFVKGGFVKDQEKKSSNKR